MDWPSEGLGLSEKVKPARLPTSLHGDVYLSVLILCYYRYYTMPRYENMI